MLIIFTLWWLVNHKTLTWINTLWFLQCESKLILNINHTNLNQKQWSVWSQFQVGVMSKLFCSHVSALKCVSPTVVWSWPRQMSCLCGLPPLTWIFWTFFTFPVFAFFVKDEVPKSLHQEGIKANICGIMDGEMNSLTTVSLLCGCHWTWQACNCQTGGVELVWWACSTHGHDANLDKHAYEKNLSLHVKWGDVIVRVWRLLK